ncbi:MAG TPA: hypothetical protein VKT30_18900 [Caulobacteraceae bacterium]|nr:hypothetical protein [Caulobacteraceae bacterium]
MSVAGGAAWRVGRWIGLGAAIAAVGLVWATAHADPVNLQIVDRDTGQTLRVWRHDGRLFVAGQPGDRYSLRVTNNTGRRVMVVMSVDGVNVLNGETAGYDQDGYVFAPYQSYEVTGWRKSTTEVAAFTFAPLPDSYAARTGRPADVGVIGIAVFNERAAPPPAPYEPEEGSGRSLDEDRSAPSGANLAAPPPPPPPAALSARAAPSGGFADAERRDEKLGTAHGQREWSEVELVDFERASPYPSFVRQVEYDTYAHLVANGVIPAWRRPEHHPRPFPSNTNEDGFVPDPPG